MNDITVQMDDVPCHETFGDLVTEFAFTEDQLQNQIGGYNCPSFSLLNEVGVAWIDIKEKRRRKTMISVHYCTTETSATCNTAEVENMINNSGIDVEFFYIDTLFNPTNVEEPLTYSINSGLSEEILSGFTKELHITV